MRKFGYLVKRHCLVFLRDRMAVFFSLLSMIIIIVLMGMFLSKMNVDSIMSLLGQFRHTTSADRANAGELVSYWTLAGILMTNALTVATSVIGIYIEDMRDHVLDCFYSAPVRRSVVSLSYIAAAMMMGMLMCCLTLAVYLAFIVANGGRMLTVAHLLQVLGGTAVNVCLFSIMTYGVAICLRRTQSWSALASMSGTLVGFLGGIYLPLGYLPSGVATFLKLLPFLNGASILRRSCVQDIAAETFRGCPDQVLTEYQSYVGTTFPLNGHMLTTPAQLGIMALWGLFTLALILAVTRRKHLSR